MSILIGNMLNSNNKKILDKMNKMDFEFIQREVINQIREGAEFIELNAISLYQNEVPFLKEAIRIIEGCGGKALIRSNNIEALIDCINIAQNELVIGNIEFKKEKIDKIVDFAQDNNVKIVAWIDDCGSDYDSSPEKSLLIAQMYVDYLLDKGMKRHNILLAPMVKPLEEDFNNGKNFLTTLELFKLDFPQVKTIANLSILSEGLPMRGMISTSFVSLAVEKGLDYIILDVLEKSIVESIITTLSIIGKDKNMQTYLNFCRNSKESRKRNN